MLFFSKLLDKNHIIVCWMYIFALIKIVLYESKQINGIEIKP